MPEPRRATASVLTAWTQQHSELLDHLVETIIGLSELEAGWSTPRFEQAFGFRIAPPLVLTGSERMMRLHGFIDRIDVNSVGELRVIDYKTGSSPVNLSRNDLSSEENLLGLISGLEHWRWSISSILSSLGYRA